MALPKVRALVAHAREPARSRYSHELVRGGGMLLRRSGDGGCFTVSDFLTAVRDVREKNKKQEPKESYPKVYKVCRSKHKQK